MKFQNRGGDHEHGLLWIKSASIYGKGTNIDVEKFVDKYLSIDSLVLTKDLRTIQHHHHTISCRKHKNSNCRFNFPIPPLKTTKILEPIEFDTVKTKKNARLISDTINNVNYDEMDTFDKFLHAIGLKNDEYVHAIQFTLNCTTLLLQRKPTDTSTNSYPRHIPSMWIANTDSQFVLDSYATAMHCNSYMTKEDKTLTYTFKNIHENCLQTKSDIMNTINCLGKALVNMQQMHA